MRLPEISLAKKGLLIAGVPLIFSLVSTATLIYLYKQAEVEASREHWTRSVLDETSNLVKFMVESTTMVIMDLALKQRNFVLQSAMSFKQMQSSLDSLRVMCKNDADALAHVSRLQAIKNEVLGVARQAIEVSDLADGMGPMQMMDLRQKVMDCFVRFKRELTQLREALLARKDEAPRLSANYRQALAVTLVVCVLGNVLISVFIAGFIARTITRRLEVIIENSHRLARHAPLLDKLPGGDEIAVLDSAFHDAVAALNTAEQREREATRVKKQLIATIAHDIRTPLSSVQATLALLGRGAWGELSDTARTKLSGTENEAKRLIRLFNDLIALEKNEIQVLNLERVPVSLDDLVGECTEAMKGLAKEADVSIEAHCPSLLVMGDRDRLQQVLINLLSNAIKFSPLHTVISVAVTSEPDYAEVTVSDQGPGVPPEHQEAIFQQFKQVRLQDATEKGGAGLGLAICKSIVEAHGGTLGVRNNLDLGASFWFRIPLVLQREG